MNLLKLPMALVKDMKGLVARFWWSNKNEGDGIHCVLYEEICRPKW